MNGKQVSPHELSELEKCRDALLQYLDYREAVLMQTEDVCSVDEQLNGIFGLNRLFDELRRLDSQIYELRSKA